MDYNEDMKKAFIEMLRNEGQLTDEEIANRARNSHFVTGGTIINLLTDFAKYRYNKEYNQTSDKYRHALINCLASQRGVKDAIRADQASRLREFSDVMTGSNTQEASNDDMYANLIGRYLGLKYPEGDCDELVQRYIKKTY